MDLFSTETIVNILPYDGIADYHGIVLNRQESNHYYDRLMETIDWKNDEAIIFGKRIITKRKVAWYGDNDFSYTYSNITRSALSWTSELLELKQLAENKTGAIFNSCLLNLYHNGEEGVGWHSDDEKSLGKNAPIASISFGAERTFSFRHKRTKDARTVILETGSLLVMAGETQTHWLHALPKTKKVSKPRINLTFRIMKNDGTD